MRHFQVSASHGIVEGLEAIGGVVPTISRLNQGPGATAELVRLRRIFKKSDHRLCESAWLIGDKEMLSVNHVESFAAHARGNDRLTHRHSLEDFESCSTANAQGHNHDCRLCQVRSNIIDAPCVNYTLAQKRPQLVR
jgi:hypothetical protein